MENCPDIIATVQLYATEHGGRKMPTPPDLFRCLFAFEENMFDCALITKESGSIFPGTSTRVPIVFLYKDLIKFRLNVGSKFKLWEMGIIGEGVVNEII